MPLELQPSSVTPTSNLCTTGHALDTANLVTAFHAVELSNLTLETILETQPR